MAKDGIYGGYNELCQWGESAEGTGIFLMLFKNVVMRFGSGIRYPENEIVRTNCTHYSQTILIDAKPPSGIYQRNPNRCSGNSPAAAFIIPSLTR